MFEEEDDIHNNDTFGDHDEHDRDTFGEEVVSRVGQDKFAFGSRGIMGRENDGESGQLPFDSAITIVRRLKDVPMDSTDDLPPGMAMSPPRRVLTLAEIEAGIAGTTLRDGPKLFRTKVRPTTITFPTEEDPYRSTMTRYEREGISRIHLTQLTTEHPEIEDFYYKAFAQRRTRKRTSDAPLYLPLPTPRKREQKQLKTSEALVGALGKAVSSSSRKPRQLLQLASSKMAAAAQFSVSASIERIYEAIFVVEDALTTDPNVEETDYDRHHLQDCRRIAIEVLKRELLLDQSIDQLATNETLLMRFLSVMAQAKTKRILGRALKAIDSTGLSELTMVRLVEFFEYLDICRPEAPEADIELFIGSVLAALVPFMAKCPLEPVQGMLQTLATKAGLPWITTNKAGIVLCCIVFSRLEILKAANAEGSTSTTSTSAASFASFFDPIQERLSDVFTNLHGLDSEFYGWQFMALLAMNVDADRKRIMVMELRDRIMGVVQSGNTKGIANLNIFLNVLTAMGWTTLRLSLCLVLFVFIVHCVARGGVPQALQFVGNQLEPLPPPPLVCCDPACPACVLGPLPPAAPYGDNIDCNGGRCPCISCTCCYTMTIVYCETITCTSETTDTITSLITDTFTTFTDTLFTEQSDLTFTVLDTIFFTESVTSTTTAEDTSSVVTSIIDTTSATISTIFLTTVFETTSSSLTTTLVINTWPSRETLTVPVTVLARRRDWPRELKDATFSITFPSYAATIPTTLAVSATSTNTAEINYTSVEQLDFATETISIARTSLFTSSFTSTVSPRYTFTSSTRLFLIPVTRLVSITATSTLLATAPTRTTRSISYSTSLSLTSTLTVTGAKL
ncbi:Topoisomerase II-associated protein PAT1 domain-containing protein [Paramicrosporidium saccamoebae]|uniref:Topoisomerase II-associated protein PAT1 domain-containing protein n=1 Tax=Paramicrosporidium saccamoebae TaxID=1246581 RepID=A0A2H9THP8_9FUNG|nr:Topoisomerase II-associated protein PAT1 domain-containing protein [Paramicrosporidium saccamoebae]